MTVLPERYVLYIRRPVLLVLRLTGCYRSYVRPVRQMSFSWCALELRNRILQPQLARVLLTLIRPYDLSMFSSPCVRTWEFMFSIPNWLNYDITVLLIRLGSCVIFNYLQSSPCTRTQELYSLTSTGSYSTHIDLALWLFDVFISVR